MPIPFAAFLPAAAGFIAAPAASFAVTRALTGPIVLPLGQPLLPSAARQGLLAAPRGYLTAYSPSSYALARTGAATPATTQGMSQQKMMLIALGAIGIGSAILAFTAKPQDKTRKAIAYGAGAGSLLGIAYLLMKARAASAAARANVASTSPPFVLGTGTPLPLGMGFPSPSPVTSPSPPTAILSVDTSRLVTGQPFVRKQEETSDDPLRGHYVVLTPPANGYVHALRKVDGHDVDVLLTDIARLEVATPSPPAPPPAAPIASPTPLKLPGENGAVFVPEINGPRLVPGRVFITREPAALSGDPPAGRFTALTAIQGSLGNGTVRATNSSGYEVTIPIMSIVQLIGPDV